MRAMLSTLARTARLSLVLVGTSVVVATSPTAVAQENPFVHLDPDTGQLRDADGSLFRFRGANYGAAFVTPRRGEWASDRARAALDYFVLGRQSSDMAEAGLNVVRLAFDYYLLMPDEQQPDHSEGETGAYVFDSEGFEWLEQSVSQLRAGGLRVILNIHFAPGGCGMGDCFYHSGQRHCFTGDDEVSAAEYWNRRVALWEEIADRFRDSEAIAAYEPTNETRFQFPYGWPVGQGDPALSPDDHLWFEYVDAFNDDLEAAIRAVDSQHLLVRVAPHDANHRQVFVPYLAHMVNDGYRPADDNTILALHLYHPSAFVFGRNPGTNGWINVWPGVIRPSGITEWQESPAIADSLAIFAQRQGELQIPMLVDEMAPGPQGGEKDLWGEDQHAFDTIRLDEELGFGGWAVWGGLTPGFYWFSPTTADPWSAYSLEWQRLPPEPLAYQAAPENAQRPPGQMAPYFPRRVDSPFPETFTADNQLGWSRDASGGASGEWSLDQGALHIALSAGQHASSRAGFTDWTDLTISGRIRLDTDRSRAGLLARGRDSSTYYQALLGDGGLAIERVLPGDITEMVRTDAASQPGVFQWLELTVADAPRGLALSALLRSGDGRELARVEALDSYDVAIGRGRVGVAAADGPASFDDVDVALVGAVVSDSFDSSSAGWSLTDGMEIAEGALRINTQSRGQASRDGLPEDFDLSLRWRVLEADGATLGVRFRGAGDTYYELAAEGVPVRVLGSNRRYSYLRLYRVSADGHRQLNVLSGELAIQRLTPVPIERGRTYDLRIRCDDGPAGVALEVYLDDLVTPKLRVVDPEPLQGDELTLFVDNGRVVGWFDDLRVLALSHTVSLPASLAFEGGLPAGLHPVAGRWTPQGDRLEVLADVDVDGFAVLALPSPLGAFDLHGTVRVDSVGSSAPNLVGVGLYCQSLVNCIRVYLRADTGTPTVVAIYRTSPNSFRSAPILGGEEVGYPIAPLPLPADADLPFRIEVRDDGGRIRVRLFIAAQAPLPDEPILDWTDANADHYMAAAGNLTLLAGPAVMVPGASVHASFGDLWLTSPGAAPPAGPVGSDGVDGDADVADTPPDAADGTASSGGEGCACRVSEQTQTAQLGPLLALVFLIVCRRRWHAGPRRHRNMAPIWLDHMKTTLDLNDELLTEAKRRAAEAGMTLRAYVEDALRGRMLPRPSRFEPFRLALPVVEGSAPPAVDTSDRRLLYDFMDGRG